MESSCICDSTICIFFKFLPLACTCVLYFKIIFFVKLHKIFFNFIKTLVHCGLRRANRKFKYSKLRVKGKSLTTRPTKQMQCWLYLEILWKKQGFKVAVFDSRFIFVFKDGISPLSYVDIELHL